MSQGRKSVCEKSTYLVNIRNSALVSNCSSISSILFFLQKYLIDRICNVTHAYNHQNITYGQELIIELTYNTPYPGYYGNTGCRIFKPGIQNLKDFCLKINIDLENEVIKKLMLISKNFNKKMCF